MGLFLIFLGFCFVNAILCYDSDGSSEVNRIEFTPLYETIIYSDVADIIKDFENNKNSPLETLINNDDSESDENVDELLAEYQHYLDRAHKQRKSYIEKSNPKKKVPLLTRDKYSKSQTILTNKHNDFYTHNTKNYNQGEIKFPQSTFKAPLEFLLPMNMLQSSYFNSFEPDGSNFKEKSIQKSPLFKSDHKMFPLPTMSEPTKSSCLCDKMNPLCECDSGFVLDPNPVLKQFDHDDLVPFLFNEIPRSMRMETSEPSLNDLRPKTDTLNIRINVDVQFPNFQEAIGKLVKNNSNDQIVEPAISKESNINLPFPFFNFPMPLEMFEHFKKANQDSPPIHKITIHRKKKSKTNSNGKRHRKKLISFHNIKLDSQQPAQPSLDENYNTSDHQQKLDNKIQSNQTNRTYNLTHKIEQGHSNITNNNITNNKTAESSKPDENIYLMVNIRNNADNITEDVHRNENSIEADYTRGFANSSSKMPMLRKKKEASNQDTEADYTRGFSNISSESPMLRKKRDVSNQNISASEDKKTESKSKTEIVNVASKDILTKKEDKILTEDAELLLWPDNSNGLSSAYTRNITTLILDTENKKVKLNLSSEAIRQNRTKALEQAIFGDVNWDDVDTVAPVFMSFMGKYIRGVLTFCSESVCHSMKCAEKACVHRTCAPSDRLNNKGHCAGSNTTDSVASLEAIMDLPSNVALEIVDILQDKMLGKLFGKATLCISSKCVTFVVSKKSFLKTKCTSKDLNVLGHCTNVKNVKIM